jgi:hypothetical protein
MKIIDVPQTGKCGLTVTFPSRNGLIRRAWVVPANPRSPDQTVVRSNLSSVASLWKQISEAQQDAWITAAGQEQSRPTLGQSGPLTGLQLFTKINATLLKLGEAVVSDPPAKPQFPQLPVTALEITNTAGTIALKLACSDDLELNTVVYGAPPQSAGTRRPITWRWLGICPTVSGGYSTITTLYSDEYGVPAVGSRIFVRVREHVDGWAGPEQIFQATVPAAA